MVSSIEFMFNLRGQQPDGQLQAAHHTNLNNKGQ